MSANAKYFPGSTYPSYVLAQPVRYKGRLNWALPGYDRSYEGYSLKLPILGIEILSQTLTCPLITGDIGPLCQDFVSAKKLTEFKRALCRMAEDVIADADPKPAGGVQTALALGVVGAELRRLHELGFPLELLRRYCVGSLSVQVSEYEFVAACFPELHRDS